MHCGATGEAAEHWTLAISWPFWIVNPIGDGGSKERHEKRNRPVVVRPPNLRPTIFGLWKLAAYYNDLNLSSFLIRVVRRCLCL